ncbi:MAG: hypothetical protein K2X47_04725, partial [Bdellovibrionales bacterium]|nr:hypothetical protein [Bdellovibrionales bacterium]
STKQLKFDTKGLPAGTYTFLICAEEKMESQECSAKLNQDILDMGPLVVYGRDVLGPWLWHTSLYANYFPVSDVPTFEIGASGLKATSLSKTITTGVYGADRNPHKLSYSGFPMLLAKGKYSYGGGTGPSSAMCPTDDPASCECPPEDPTCDQESPLIIDLGHDVAHAAVELSSQEEGVDFDIRNDGTKVRISWPKNPQKDMFLALPKNGEILSSEQLFGNRTKGADGEEAANGFLALKEYASKERPLVIDSRDAIYHDLRLWSDLNRDGLAQPHELFTLAEKNVKSISLDYAEMNAKDVHGNSTRQRSSIEMMDSTKRMIFDIWFKVGDDLF